MTKALYTLKSFIVTSLCVVSFSLAQSSYAAETQPNGGMWGPGVKWWKDWNSPGLVPWQKQRLKRHMRFMRGDLPDQYKKMKNPLAFTPENIDAGRKLYESSCMKCHGAKGMGNGDLAKNLQPSPAFLAYLIQRPVAADAYLMWTVSEGGTKNKTSMPAFKGDLAQEDIWRIVIYMRAGFPDSSGSR